MSAPKNAPAVPTAVARLDALAAMHGEWAPWLSILHEIIPELSSPAWDGQPPLTVAETELSPWLAGATLRPDGPSVARLLDRLDAAARTQGLEALAGRAGRASPTSVDQALAVFLAAVNHDDATLDRQASLAGATPEGWRTMSQLLTMPYLHACARAWTAGRSNRWSQGYCPVCGAWPAFAEMRGIERARHLRCGRCGAGWPMPALTCTYCGTTDHDALGTLVSDETTARWTVDICHRCSGWLKSMTTLQTTPSSEILAADLASVEFDLAAIDHGFLRPQGPGAVLNAMLTTTDSVGRSRSWS